MTLEQLKENDRYGIITDARSIEAIVRQFEILPVKELYHPEMRTAQLKEQSLLDDLLESAGIPLQKKSDYDYSHLANIIYHTIVESNSPENQARPNYAEVNVIMDDMALLPCRFVPAYRKRKGR